MPAGAAPPGYNNRVSSQVLIQRADLACFRPAQRNAQHDQDCPNASRNNRNYRANNAAVNPDSNAPNSFDVPMKILFTDETRPRISSGVTNCTMEPRMITLTLSNAPTRNNSPSDNQNILDKPNRTVAIPN